MRRTLIAVAAVLLLAGCGGPGTFTLGGTVKLSGDQYTLDGLGGCQGDGGYGDLAAGTQVTVTGPAGEVLALGRITGSDLVTATGDPYEGVLVSTFGADCVLMFSVPNVPAGHEFYGVEVSHRGVVQTTATEAQSGLLALTIG